MKKKKRFLKCPACEIEFGTIKELRLHIYNSHLVEKQYFGPKGGIIVAGRTCWCGEIQFGEHDQFHDHSFKTINTIYHAHMLGIDP